MRAPLGDPSGVVDPSGVEVGPYVKADSSGVEVDPDVKVDPSDLEVSIERKDFPSLLRELAWAVNTLCTNHSW